MQEMVDKNSAYFIVIPLFLFTPALTLRLVYFSNKFQALLIGVVPQLVLQEGLVEVESLEVGGRGLWVFLHDFLD